MPIDYTNDSQDDTQEAGYSLDGLECSNFVLTDYSYAKFQDTILDSPVPIYCDIEIFFKKFSAHVRRHFRSQSKHEAIQFSCSRSGCVH